MIGIFLIIFFQALQRLDEEEEEEERFSFDDSSPYWKDRCHKCFRKKGQCLCWEPDFQNQQQIVVPPQSRKTISADDDVYDD